MLRPHDRSLKGDCGVRSCLLRHEPLPL